MADDPTPSTPATDDDSPVVDDGADADADAAAGQPGDGHDGPVGDAEHVDELPEDLDAAGYVGPYLFPNNNRRRIPGYLYLVTAAACLAAWLLVDDSPYVNGGLLLAAGILAVVGVYSIVTGWNLDVDEQDALVAASRAVGFPVGHASAQMGWRGLLSRPTWRILLYSAENPPAKRGLVLVDGVDGEIVQHFVEDNPEDWSDLDTGGSPADDTGGTDVPPAGDTDDTTDTSDTDDGRADGAG
ncbi:MAG TPA: hypothetical protein VJM49_18825 [Acidimicrobiales bacterium]|nr:hypothetical protein [Acidimicrobiales bacterium]